MRAPFDLWVSHCAIEPMKSRGERKIINLCPAPGFIDAGMGKTGRVLTLPGRPGRRGFRLDPCAPMVLSSVRAHGQGKYTLTPQSDADPHEDSTA